MNMPTRYPQLITFIALIFLIILHLHQTQKPQHHHHHHHHHQQQHPFSHKGKLTFQEKTRLGSTPPTCHNKCNVCQPCMAVQVPSTPSRKKGAALNDAVDEEHSWWSSSPTRTSNAMEYSFDPSPYSGRYSNYKPVGWKCRCGNYFYNP